VLGQTLQYLTVSDNFTLLLIYILQFAQEMVSALLLATMSLANWVSQKSL